MGQKVNPNSLRFGLNKNWVSRWNAQDGKTRAKWILEDEAVRKLLKEKFRPCGVGYIEIERFANANKSTTIVIYLHVSQIGLLYSGEKEIQMVHRGLKKILGKNINIKLEPRELANPSVSAELIGQEIVDVIQNRLPHRSSVKRLMKKSMLAGAQGIKVKISGRINGVEIARSESYADGSVPLSTFRADIDYSFQTAKTSYGIIGVKVWVNRGLYFGKRFMPLPSAPSKGNWKSDKSKDNKYIAATY
ncbi:30S ribosomal protein S3 [Candidatus Mycoplasma haematohominis]|uniref:Small ribosomal subunit protein uS3 n=1 Tax=Candidatus Mycoplasma haematohominis TaxID=1494318 RepID=A0A478FR05_9MOLU|nr:30S ribosomal protein S3 [Candidatus Mycoplasma haemohominis]GCE63971.1 30S ribosomal protein S3 [Candidatus Mycoplasma haemohominis]